VAKAWCMTRLQRATVGALREYADSLLDQHSKGKLELPNDQADHVSLDYAVLTLLGKVQRHRKRAKNSNEKRKKQPKSASSQDSNSP